MSIGLKRRNQNEGREYLHSTSNKLVFNPEVDFMGSIDHLRPVESIVYQESDANLEQPLSNSSPPPPNTISARKRPRSLGLDNRSESQAKYPRNHPLASPNGFNKSEDELANGQTASEMNLTSFKRNLAAPEPLLPIDVESVRRQHPQGVSNQPSIGDSWDLSIWPACYPSSSNQQFLASYNHCGFSTSTVNHGDMHTDQQGQYFPQPQFSATTSYNYDNIAKNGVEAVSEIPFQSAYNGAQQPSNSSYSTDGNGFSHQAQKDLEYNNWENNTSSNLTLTTPFELYQMQASRPSFANFIGTTPISADPKFDRFPNPSIQASRLNAGWQGGSSTNCLGTPGPPTVHLTPGMSAREEISHANQLGGAATRPPCLNQTADSVEYSKKTPKDFQNLMDNIRPDPEELDPRTRLGTPDAMVAAATLYEHQKLGLAWLIKMEEGSNKGGILADDMGLGKTIQAIALMVSRRSSDPSGKTTLLVAPVALLRQWEAEIKTKLKPEREHRLTTYLYHGAGRHTTWEELRKYDAVITTYGTLAAEFKRKERIEMYKKGNPNWIATTPKDRLPVLGDECKFHRVILDEAQNIKNKCTKSAQAVYCLQSLTRVAMSGTPMQNNIEELFSLVHFLQIKPYCDHGKFSTDFGRPFKSTSQTTRDNAMKKLQVLLKAILLRRTKKSKVDGKPIITLPERTTGVQHAVFSDDEKELYMSLEKQHQLTFNKYLKAGTVGRNYTNALVLLLRLRQACCHPHLMKDFGMPEGATAGTADVSVVEMIKLAKELSIDTVARIKETGDMINECPICMDMTENATIFIPCGHSTCSECFIRIQDPTQAHDDADMGGVAVKCPNCRGKVDSKQVTDWNSFKKVHLPELLDETAEPEAEAELEAASGSDSDDSNNDDSDGSLASFIVDDDEDGSGLRGKESKNYKGKEKVKGPKELKATLAQLKLASRKNVKARRKYLRRLNKDFITSSKIEKTLEILDQIQKNDDSEKTIIFSQFTALLDLLEVALNHQDYRYERYDGSMSSNARNDAVIKFAGQADCKLMLVSLKAGNSGLNLTCASQVIMLDPFWNPFVEEQAIDRAHRIGQRRPVQVHRLLVPETIEDRIMALQEKKRGMIEGALDENASASIGRLGVQELAFLFGVPHL